MDLAGPQRGHDVGLVRDGAEHQLVHVGQALLEVVGVLLQHELLLHLPVRQHEGAGSERGLVEIAVLLDARLADDEAPEPAEGREQARERLLGDELHHVLAGRLDLVHRDEVGLAGGLLEEPVEGELDVRGGQLLAVVELHALAQLEGPGEAVLARLPRLGQLGIRRHVLVEAHELAVHHGRAPAAGERGDELRVEPGGLGGLGRDQGAARLRGLRGGAATDREGAEGETARLEDLATAEVGAGRAVVDGHGRSSCDGITGRRGRGHRAGRRPAG